MFCGRVISFCFVFKAKKPKSTNDAPKNKAFF